MAKSRKKDVIEADPPARSAELEELLDEVVMHPEAWMATPNVQFGGRRPNDLVNTKEEINIISILTAVKYGMR